MRYIRKRIYYRLRKPKNKRKVGSKRTKNVIILSFCTVVFCVVSVCGFYILEKRIGTLAQEAAISELNSEITKNVNRIVEEISNQDGINLAELIHIDSNGNNSTFMTTDYNAVNRIKSSLAINIQEEMDKLSIIETKIPIGMLFSDTLMTGAGINVPVKIFVANEIDIQFYSDFSDAGINQTRCRMWIEIKIPTKVAGVVSYQEDNIMTQVPLAEKIILGNVPEVYMEK